MLKTSLGKKRVIIKTIFTKIVKIINRYKFLALGGLVLLGLILFALILNSLPSPRQLAYFPYPESTQIYDRNGKLLYEIYKDQNRVSIKLEELPKHLIDATIAVEDKNFYEHHGFDLKGIGRAIVNIVFRRKLQGGSTITQQLVKNALLDQQRTLIRKAREAFLTILTEVMYPKDKILEMYFNQIPYGGTSYGIEATARTYFGKHAKDLSLVEAAMLVGLPAAPTAYSPFIHPDAAKNRQELVLRRMRELEMITEEDFKKAKEEKLVFATPGAKINAPHFVFYVKEKLVEKYGQRFVDQGGLKVTTTLDLNIQDFAQATVASEVAKLKNANVTNGAALVTNPKTGEILAMVGSKDYFAEDVDGKFNVTTALRQPGSSIKPLNYALGIKSGRVTPATIFADVATCFAGSPKTYCPRNYDGGFHGAVQLRFALGNSFNVPAVRMLALNGIENFINFASSMGLESLSKRPASDFGLSLTLGGGEVKMTEMATAFGAFATGGIKRDLVSVLKVEDHDGKLLEKHQTQAGKRVLPSEVAYLINHILLDNNARSAAFGSNSLLVIKNHPEVSVKTGTTNDRRDNWTIGYTPNFVTAVWVGNNDNTSMNQVASGVTGASPVWNKIMTFALRDKDQEWSSKPTKITGASVCNSTGTLPPAGETCESRYEFFILGFTPVSQPLKKSILINKDTGWPVQPGEQKQNLEWQEHLATTDPLGTIICFDCPAREESIIVSSSLTTKNP